MSQEDFITALFCHVDDALSDCKKPKKAKLHPSEAVTLCLLFCLKGTSARRFYLWADGNLRALFPGLPERTRLFRLFAGLWPLAQRFLSSADTGLITDSLGVEMIHPRREGRSPKQFGKKGLSNKRWIVGVKFCPLVRTDGSICEWRYDTANVHDTNFLQMVEEVGQPTLADRGFHCSKKRGGDPDNLTICGRGESNERMLIETVFSQLTGCLHLKKIAHRVEEYVCARFAYAAALYNLLLNWPGKPQGGIAWAVI